jgi:hypothetical protein
MLRIFPTTPMVAYKQPPNLKSVLCRGNRWVCNHATNFAMFAPASQQQKPSLQIKAS